MFWVSRRPIATRVGGGPFPTELEDSVGESIAKRGDEFGATTGRPRRCGWLDLAALKQATRLCGLDSVCVTKLRRSGRTGYDKDLPRVQAGR